MNASDKPLTVDGVTVRPTWKWSPGYREHVRASMAKKDDIPYYGNGDYIRWFAEKYAVLGSKRTLGNAVMTRSIRFSFAPLKARAAIHWMLRRVPNLDLHTMLKSCYFADKKHLNLYNRPVFGATYRAMRFGPVPLEVYEMAKCEAYWLPELGADRYPWAINGYKLSLTDNEEPDLSVLSESDIEALEYGFQMSRNMTFNERTATTHGKDWQEAELGVIRYEDMLEDAPGKQERIEYLQQASRIMKI